MCDTLHVWRNAVAANCERRTFAQYYPISCLRLQATDSQPETEHVTAPPRNVKKFHLYEDVYAFEVVPEKVVGEVKFTFQVGKTDSNYSVENSSAGRVQFRESACYVPLKLKARVCNDGFCSKDYYFDFVTNVGSKRSSFPFVARPMC